MFNKGSVLERYRNDNAFHALVDMMVAAIHDARFTPSEMRDAAVCASIIYEEFSIKEIRVNRIPEVIDQTLKVLHKWESEWLNLTPEERGE